MDMVAKLAVTLWVAAGVGSAAAADFTSKTIDKPVPKEIGESIRGILQPKAIQVLEGDKPLLELWLRKDVPLKSKPAKPAAAGDTIPETTVVGAVAALAEGLRDYKDNEVPKGVYVARYALQPQDGDHLGTAEFNYFFALLPADVDKELAGIKEFKPMVKASGKLTSSGHPVILSLRPAAGTGASGSIVEPAAEHKAVRIALPATAAGEKVPVQFDLVFQGHGHIQ